jgi:trk system potassium uptake protein TrkH
MFYREIFKILSDYLFFYALILFVPLGLAGYYQFFVEIAGHPQPHSTLAFGWTICICWCLALLFRFLAKEAQGILYRREALAVAVIIWFITPALGALPFFLSGTLERFDQAYLEATSGFTTTGSTVLEGKQYNPITHQEIAIKRTYCGMQETTYTFYGTIKPVLDQRTGQLLEGIEAVSRALLLWRSLMQWVGGMGIILLFITVLPSLSTGGKTLFQTESPGPIKEGLSPRLKETALKLWQIYVGLTVIEFCLLLLINPQISVLEALTIAFSTVSTGGFSMHDDNIAYYHHAGMEWVILVFMVLGSVNFGLYYHILKGKFYRLFEPEFLLYMLILLTAGFFVTWHLVGLQKITLAGDLNDVYSTGEAIRTGFFHLVSAQSSSGFFTASYDTWPHVVQAILLIVMYIGGMSGSTAGGMKVIRLSILFQLVKHKIESIFMPKTVKIIRASNKEIDQGMAISTLCFFLVMMTISVIVTFLYLLDNIDPETALGLTVSMINNTGLAFRAAGPTSTVAFLTPFSTYLSAFVMILGRLEFYAVLVIFLPAFWKIR